VSVPLSIFGKISLLLRWTVFTLVILSGFSQPVVASQLTLSPSDWVFNARDWQQPRVFFVRLAGEGGPQAEPALRVVARTQDWNNILTREFLLPDSASSVSFQGLIRTLDVTPGSAPFMSARAQIRFLDDQGTQVGDWPQGLLLSGTQDWQAFEQTHLIPPEASSVEVMLGLVNCTGEVAYANLSLRAFNDSGDELSLLPLPDEIKSDVSGWFEFTPRPPGDTPPAEGAFHAGQILGFKNDFQFSHLTIDKGWFVNDTGERVRFWGTNIGPPSTWPTPDTAKQMAERFSRSGINLVRFHHLDRGWNPDNIFESNVDHTQSLDPEKMARMDFLIHELRKRGIHVFFDLLVTRRFRSGDGVAYFAELPLGAKLVGHFDPRIIQLQKDYARRLLSHRNPHTGLTYAEDPAVALISIINESSLFLDGSLSVSFSDLPDYYKDQLDARFREWAIDQELEISPAPLAQLIRQRVPAVADFLESVQNAYYDSMVGFLRDEVGVRAPIAGSNFQEVAADARSNARLDFYDVHGYWSHPVGGWSPTDIVPSAALVKHLSGQNPFRSWASQNFKGLPLVISEWQAAWPNPAGYQMPLLLAAIASRQDWDAPIWFGLAEADWSPFMRDTFEAGNKPHYLPGFVVAGLLFHRGDIPAAPTQQIPFHYQNGFSNFHRSVHGISLLDHQIQRTLGEAEPNDTFTADNNPLAYHHGRALVINTPAAFGAIGLFEAGEEMEINNHLLRFRHQQSAQVVITSLDALPIAGETRELLILASASAENTGQVYRARKAGLRALGGAPILIEPVAADLVICTEQPDSSWQVEPLDWDGFAIASDFVITADSDGFIHFSTDSAPVPWWRLRLISTSQSK
jgi:hypothetical protein